MSRNQRTENVLPAASVSVPAGSTKLVVSKVFRIPIHARVAYKASCNVSVVAVGDVDLILQTSYDNGTTWVDADTCTLSVTATAAQYRHELLHQVAGDQTILPLGTLGRYVATAAAGESATLTRIDVPQ